MGVKKIKVGTTVYAQEDKHIGGVNSLRSYFLSLEKLPGVACDNLDIETHDVSNHVGDSLSKNDSKESKIDEIIRDFAGDPVWAVSVVTKREGFGVPVESHLETAFTLQEAIAVSHNNPGSKVLLDLGN